MVQYSGREWGKEAHPNDLSTVGHNENDFDDLLQAVLQNIARVTQPGGHYGVLVANWRQHGRYYHMPSKVVMLAPDRLEIEIIKTQHNVRSSSLAYSSRLVRTLHETLLVFRRGDDPSTFAMTFDTLQRLQALQSITWKNLIRSTIREGEVVSAKDVAQRLANHPRVQSNQAVQEKIRQTFQRHKHLFAQHGRGKYALA